MAWDASEPSRSLRRSHLRTSRRLTNRTRKTKSLAAASQTTMAGFTSKDRSLSVKTKSRSGGLLEDVRKAVSDARHGPATWYERLAPKHREELDAIKAEWKSGELGKRKKTLAKALAENMRTRGISDVGMHGVIAWLEKA